MRRQQIFRTGKSDTQRLGNHGNAEFAGMNVERDSGLDAQVVHHDLACAIRERRLSIPLRVTRSLCLQ